MEQLILRQAAIDALKEHRALYCDNTPDTFSKLSYAEKSRVDELDTAIATLVNLPPAEPKIVRCKDCKHWIPYDWMFSEAWQSKNIADYPEDEIGCELCDMSMKANDFCSRAERREVTT